VNRVGVLHSLETFALDLSQFEEGPGSDVSVKQYSRLSDGFTIVVKSFNIFGCETMYEILFMLTQLKHRFIAPLIGIILPTESTPLKIATLYYRSDSLQDVKTNNPVWWTATTKSKAIAGIALGMTSAHRRGIVHGSLNPSHILFDEDHFVHIVDFDSSHFERNAEDRDEMEERDSDAGMNSARNADVFSFASIMFDILVDDDVISRSLPFDERDMRTLRKGHLPAIPEFVPRFVRKLIEDGWSRDRFGQYSFDEIIEVMKFNNFEFEEGVDIGEVLEFVKSVEESSL
jgi:serine/threonine protein kinase